MEDIDTNNDGEIDIQEGEDWCFAYGEGDWVDPAFQVPDPNNPGDRVGARYENYANRADLDDTHKIQCR